MGNQLQVGPFVIREQSSHSQVSCGDYMKRFVELLVLPYCRPYQTLPRPRTLVGKFRAQEHH